MLSKSFRDKLNEAVAHHDFDLPDPNSNDDGFVNRRELGRYLGEGSLIGISKIAGDALAVPYGKYLVWTTNAGHTMLVPPTAPRGTDLFPEADDGRLEVATPDLLDQWRYVERVVLDARDLAGSVVNENEEGTGNPDFKPSIDMDTVDRTALARAMQKSGHTVTSLAGECGVDPPAISRILRKPRDTAGDPGGRNPSMDLASKVCSALRVDPKAAFPDFFRVDPSHKAHSKPGNRGSGHGFSKHSSPSHSSVKEDLDLGPVDKAKLAGSADTGMIDDRLSDEQTRRQDEQRAKQRQGAEPAGQLNGALDRLDSMLDQAGDMSQQRGRQLDDVASRLDTLRTGV